MSNKNEPYMADFRLTYDHESDKIIWEFAFANAPTFAIEFYPSASFFSFLQRLNGYDIPGLITEIGIRQHNYMISKEATLLEIEQMLSTNKSQRRLLPPQGKAGQIQKMLEDDKPRAD